MDLSNAQMTTLKAAIAAETNATFVARRTAGDRRGMADWLNNNQTPQESAWSTGVSRDTLLDATDVAAFKLLDQASREAWINVVVNSAPANMAKAKNRKDVVDVWGANATAAGVLTACLRPITRVEKMLIGASPTQTTQTVAGLKLDWTGPITASQIGDALVNG